MKHMKPIVIAAAVGLFSSSVYAGEMKGMSDTDHRAMSKPAQGASSHKAVGVVKNVDPQKGTVTLAHDAVQTLNWPAMTMTFKVQDKALLEKAAPGRKVEFAFEQRGKDYVVTALK